MNVSVHPRAKSKKRKKPWFIHTPTAQRERKLEEEEELVPSTRPQLRESPVREREQDQNDQQQQQESFLPHSSLRKLEEREAEPPMYSSFYSAGPAPFLRPFSPPCSQPRPHFVASVPPQEGNSRCGGFTTGKA